MLTCKETQWTHLLLEIHYTHARVGRPIKPFFEPLELCYCLYHFFSLQINHFLLLTQSLSRFDWFVETEKCVHFLAPCSSRIICQVLTHDGLIVRPQTQRKAIWFNSQQLFVGRSVVSCVMIQRMPVKQTSDLGMRLVLSLSVAIFIYTSLNFLLHCFN